MTTSTTTAGTTMQAIIQENYGEAENVLRLGQTGRPRSATARCCCACTRPAWTGASGRPSTAPDDTAVPR